MALNEAVIDHSSTAVCICPLQSLICLNPLSRSVLSKRCTASFIRTVPGSWVPVGLCSYHVRSNRYFYWFRSPRVDIRCIVYFSNGQQYDNTDYGI